MNEQIENILEKYSSHIKKTSEVYVPISDKLNYKIITLKNKLRIFFVQTPDSNISSATMQVGVGNIDNPPDINGMAHYLEHMLFMGSDLYPGETLFQNQVTKSGGFTNAYTASDHTQYYFNATDNFLELLKIFSRFFIKPSFDLKYVEKEVSAVDSEHKKNISSDSWRSMNLSGKFFIDGINSRFNTGTKETLLGESVNSNPEKLRKRLIDFYNSYYSSDRMVLFISHKILDDELINIIKQLFDEVPLHKTLHTDDSAKIQILIDSFELIKIKTVNKVNYLHIKWLINESDRFNNNICNTSYGVLSHILGHEGNGSLYQILVKRELITEIMVGIESTFKNNCVFAIQLKLSEKGFENINKIIYIIDAYIKYLIHTNSESDMFEIFFNETLNLSLLYMDTLDSINGLELCEHYADIYNKTHVDLQYIPITGILYNEIDVIQDQFKKVLNQMTLNMAKIMITSNLINEKELTLTDEYYGTKYSHSTIQIDLILQEKMSKLTFNMIEPNHYVAKANNIKIIDRIIKSDKAYHRIESKHNNVYFIKTKNTFHTYTIVGYISIQLDQMKDANAQKYIALLIYCMYIKKKFQPDLYLLDATKINVDLTPEKDKISIIIEAFNSDLDITTVFIDVMKWYGMIESNNDMNLDFTIYNSVYDEIKTELENYKYSNAYTLIRPEFKNMLNKDHSITNDQMIEALKYYSPKKVRSDFAHYCINLMKVGNITAVFGGSFSLKKVEKFITILDNMIEPPNKSDSRITYDISIDKLSKKQIIHNKNPNNNEIAIGYGIYIGKIRESIYIKKVDKINKIEDIINLWQYIKPMCMILESYISMKFSALLRTEKEVGYVVLANLVNISQNHNGDIFLLFTVQSTRNDLEDLVKEYIDHHMMQDIIDVTEEDFELMKQSTISDLSEKPTNIQTDCGNQIMSLIDTYEDITNINNIDNRFNRKKIMIVAIKIINKSIFEKFVKYILDQNITSILLIEPEHLNRSTNQKN
jgi:insulysin